MKAPALLRSPLHLSLLGVLAVLVITVAYIFGAVLDTPLLSRPMEVTVRMAATGGLFEGSAVTCRGVKVGKVQQIRLTSSGVEARIQLTADTEIPRDSAAKVRSLSPVGEQYLDFQPRRSGGPWLQDGSVVTASSVDLPKTLASTVISIDKLLGQVDDRKLHTLLTELSVGLSGTGTELGRTLQQGRLIVGDLNRLWPATERLLVNAGTVGDIGIDQAANIRSLARSSRQVASFLRAYDPQLRKTLERGPNQIRQLRALVRDATRELPGWFRDAIFFTDLFGAHEPHLRALFAAYSPGIGVLGKAIRNGQLMVDGIPQRDQRCRYRTARRSPRETHQRPLVTDQHCPGSFPRLQRGAAHAPGPVR